MCSNVQALHETEREFEMDPGPDLDPAERADFPNLAGDRTCALNAAGEQQRATYPQLSRSLLGPDPADVVASHAADLVTGDARGF